jgi:cation transport ATPase
VREVKKTGTREGARARRFDPLHATGLAVLALAILLIFPNQRLGWLAACLVLLCAGVNARIPLPTASATRSLRVVAPVGLALATLAGLLAPDPEAQRWSLTGATGAALLVSIRIWVHAALAAPLRMVAQSLRSTLPLRARVPTDRAFVYEEVPTASLRQGDLVVVLEGELAPVDGVVEEGAGLGLRYPKATHSRPLVEGDFVLAGARMLEGAVTIRVRRTGQDRGIVRAIELGSRMQPDRTMALRFRFAVAQWSWLLLAPGAVAAIVWAGPAGAATLLLGLPLLALLFSIDVPIEAGALASARRGMLFGSPRAMLDAGRTSTTAILLRGALTAGEPIVQRAQALGTMDLNRAVALAAAAEDAAGGHPIARAIQHYARDQDLPLPSVRRERLHAGLGVTAATSHGVPVVVGRRQLLLDQGISVATADGDAVHIESEGLTPIFIAVDGRLEALLAILDPTHVGARDAVQRIADLPSEVVILSGDDRRTVERVAAQLGASRVKAPLLPQERIAEVRALRETGGVTATIGRGGEDDAVLAGADVPISLRLVGSGLEDRGIVIASQDVRDAAGALWVARAVRQATQRSLGVSFLGAILVVLGAGFGWMTPLIAALCALAIEAWTLRAGSHLLRRVDLRVPMQQ